MDTVTKAPVHAISAEIPSKRATTNTNFRNFHNSYAAITARAFNATYVVTSWSGKGMVRNYGDKKTTSPDPMPSYFTNAVANLPKYQYDFAFQPDIVVINLGTNDFSTKPNPSFEEFSGGYNKFLDVVRQKYGDVKIFCMNGPYKIPYTPQIVADRKDLKIKFADVQDVLGQDDWGCDGHPNVQGQTKMANILIGIIRNSTIEDA